MSSRRPEPQEVERDDTATPRVVDLLNQEGLIETHPVPARATRTRST